MSNHLTDTPLGLASIKQQQDAVSTIHESIVMEKSLSNWTVLDEFEPFAGNTKHDVSTNYKSKEGDVEVYGASFRGSDEHREEYKTAIENVSASMGISEEAMHFNQDWTVITQKGFKVNKDGTINEKSGATARGITFTPAQAEKTEVTFHKDAVPENSVAHEWAHRFSAYLSSLNAEGGTRKINTATGMKTDSRMLTTYQGSKAPAYIKDYASFKTEKERKEFFYNRVISNVDNKMRPKLKVSVATLMSTLLTDKAMRHRNSTGWEDKNYGFNPEEMFARAITMYHILKSHERSGGSLDIVQTDTNEGKAEVMVTVSEGKARGHWISPSTYKAIDSLLKTLKKHKYTVSQLESEEQQLV